MLRNLVLFTFFSCLQLSGLSVGGFCNERTGLSLNEQIMVNSSYPFLKNFSMTLLDRFPPDKWVYVGIGGSPAGVVAFLEEFGRIRDSSIVAFNLPISGLSWKSPSKAIEMFSGVALDRHFDTFIPREDKLGNRGIVVLDYPDGGASIVNGSALISDYFERHAKTRLIHLFPITYPDYLSNLDELPLDIFDVPGAHMLFFRNTEFKEAFREYGRVDLSQSDISVNGPFLKYQKLRQMLAAMIEQDKYIGPEFSKEWYESALNQVERLSSVGVVAQFPVTHTSNSMNTCRYLLVAKGRK
jgi:hypothetical protein